MSLSSKTNNNIKAKTNTKVNTKANVDVDDEWSSFITGACDDDSDDVECNINYDMLLVDAGGDRVGIYDFIDSFNTNIPIIFDDTMCTPYLKCANMVAEKLKKKCITYNCKPNKYAVVWFEGKQFSLIM